MPTSQCRPSGSSHEYKEALKSRLLHAINENDHLHDALSNLQDDYYRRSMRGTPASISTTYSHSILSSPPSGSPPVHLSELRQVKSRVRFAEQELKKADKIKHELQGQIRESRGRYDKAREQSEELLMTLMMQDAREKGRESGRTEVLRDGVEKGRLFGWCDGMGIPVPNSSENDAQHAIMGSNNTSAPVLAAQPQRLDIPRPGNGLKAKGGRKFSSSYPFHDSPTLCTTTHPPTPSAKPPTPKRKLSLPNPYDNPQPHPPRRLTSFDHIIRTHWRKANTTTPIRLLDVEESEPLLSPYESTDVHAITPVVVNKPSIEIYRANGPGPRHVAFHRKVLDRYVQLRSIIKRTLRNTLSLMPAKLQRRKPAGEMVYLTPTIKPTKQFSPIPCRPPSIASNLTIGSNPILVDPRTPLKGRYLPISPHLKLRDSLSSLVTTAEATSQSPHDLREKALPPLPPRLTVRNLSRCSTVSEDI